MDHFEEKGVGNDSSMLRGLSFTLVMRLKKQRILKKKLWWEEVFKNWKAVFLACLDQAFVACASTYNK